MIFQNRFFDIYTGELITPIETPNYTVVQVAESYYLSGFEVAPHRQICDLEITLPLTNGIFCYTDGQSQKMVKNTPYLSFRNEAHSLRCSKSGRFQTLAFNIKAGPCQEFINLLNGYEAERRDISRQMTQIISEFTVCPMAHFPLQLDCLITEILIALHRGASTPASPNLSPKDLPARLLNYLDNHYLELNTAEVLATKFGYTYSHLCKLFKRAYQISPGDYLIGMRMHHARQLLEAGASVASVAEALGYASPFNFSRAYKNHFGEPPSAHKGK